MKVEYWKLSRKQFWMVHDRSDAPNPLGISWCIGIMESCARIHKPTFIMK